MHWVCKPGYVGWIVLLCTYQRANMGFMCLTVHFLKVCQYFLLTGATISYYTVDLLKRKLKKPWQKILKEFRVPCVGCMHTQATILGITFSKMKYHLDYPILIIFSLDAKLTSLKKVNLKLV